MVGAEAFGADVEGALVEGFGLFGPARVSEQSREIAELYRYVRMVFTEGMAWGIWKMACKRGRKGVYYDLAQGKMAGFPILIE